MPTDRSTPTPHDALFRAAFEHPAAAAGELVSVLPAPLAAVLDAASVHLESASYIEPALGERRSDLLFSARFGEETALVYLLFEHQSTADARMAFRMLAYLVRIWERWEREHDSPIPERATWLPPIIPIIVSHARDGWTAPTELHAMVRPPPSAIDGLAPLVPSLRVLVDDLTRVTNEDLHARALAPFPKIALWLLRDGRDPDTLLRNLATWANALHEVASATDGMRAMQLVLAYLNRVLEREHFDEFRDKMVELAPATEEPTMRYSDYMIEKGREQGIALGRTEGQRATLVKQLTLKFGPLDGDTLARIDAATPLELEHALEKILSADALAGVLTP
ncbi:MAG TPA: Rpn family recombination-promoting nuclease/putative transposase [Nannocystaceae bacterium]|nr:Rpn family recombination-promoting nuclease/putative transposase [Nannocystaceae bacterium]